MHVEKTVRYGAEEYAATREGITAYGSDERWARENLHWKEKRAREGGAFEHLIYPACRNLLLAGANLVLRPLPTALLGAIVWCMHWLAIAALPAGSWWTWGAHAFFASVAAASMSRGVAEIEAEEGRALNALAPVAPVRWQILYWGLMAASVVASGYLVGTAYEWLAARDWIEAAKFPYGRDGAQLAAGLAAFVWRRAFHATLEHPPIPGTRL
jgi:hypothetical protein